MIVPNELIVRVFSQSPTGKGIPRVLVWYNTYLESKFYYSGLVGLTDSSGVARIDSSAIKATFEEDQRRFPMDYKVPLEACDDDIEVGADGGQEFVGARDLALVGSVLTDRNRALWSEAQNEMIRSARVRRPLLLVPSSSIIDLIVKT